MNAHKTRLRAIVLCLSICLGIVGLWACKREIYNFKHQYDNLTLAQLQEKTDIVFPLSARMLRHSAIVGLSGEIRAKIVMNKKDASQFVSRLEEQVRRAGHAADISTRDNLGIDTLGYSHPEWWKPDSARQFVAVRFYGNLQVVFVDLDMPNTAIVYLLWGH